MKYYDEMLDKYGFNDGCLQPAECWAAQEAYVTAINLLAAQWGVAERAVAMPREGCHNGCRIFFTDDPTMKGGLNAPDDADDFDYTKIRAEPGPDLRDIICFIHDNCDIDDAVEIQASCNIETVRNIIDQYTTKPTDNEDPR